MSRHSILRFHKKGSLLIEALLAITILSIGLTMIIQSYLSGFRAALYTQDYSTAAILLENKMVNLMQVGFIGESVDEEGVFPEPYGKFRYRLETRNAKNEVGTGSLNEVLLRVSWASGKRNNAMSLATYLFNLPK